MRIVAKFGLGLLVLLAAMMQTPAFAKQKAVVAVPVISQLVKQSEEGAWYGPLIDVLREAEKQSAFEFDIRVVPFKRAVMMTKSGAADFGIFLESPKRNQMALPVKKLGEAVYVVVSLKTSPIRAISQLHGKIIAQIRGGSTVGGIKAVPDLQIHPFNKHADGVKMLKAKRVDALLTADFRVLEAIEKEDLTYSDIARPVPVEGRGLWMYWSWKSNLDFNEVRALRDSDAVKIEGFNPQELFETFIN